MGVHRLLRCCVLAMLIVAGRTGAAGAQEVKHRISVLVDSSGSMLLTPEIVTFPESCVANNNWNGCTSTGNPTVGQEQCNACMAWTIRGTASCASNFSGVCRAAYASCWRFFNGGVPPACGQLLGLTGGVSTRGDGSALTAGCDVDSDGQANDSRIYQAKEALQDAIGGSDAIELSLWRYAQIEGGQACSLDADCPDTPANQSHLTCENVAGADRCALDASSIASVAGQCNRFTWNGADASFSCAQCFDGGAERVSCEAYALGQIRTGGISSLGTVDCAHPSTMHPFMMSHGAFDFGGVCDPTGAERLVDFPATGADDNHPAILSWIDHQQPNLTSDVELDVHGASPIAASLRDMRAAVLESAQLDPHTPCRKHHVIALLGNGESCETVAAAAAAAGTFQNMQFTNANGVVVNDYDVPVSVIAFGICPAGQLNCQTRQDLDSIAAAGGTGSAILVDSQLSLEQAISQIVATLSDAEACNPPAVPALSQGGRVALLLLLVAALVSLARAGFPGLRGLRS